LTPEMNTYCADSNVNNALAIVNGMTTELADRVRVVSATDAESTLLTLEDGIEIAFGTAEDIREKERICLEIMEQNPGAVAYINVRVVDAPTWRSV
ncbi:MAG: cell division protein FtsQ/DivIB, partial [Eggerthellaceae bacterium]|nr:cell division protein FtsQ/DivIB [Eggerthellaceae bacterium]